MAETLNLIGLDFGSTTSSAVMVRATSTLNCVTGRHELAASEVLFKSEPVFTPFIDERIDEAAIARLLDGWLAGRAKAVHGGVIVTGLAAQRENAAAIGKLVRERLGEAFVATADDPDLESWVAFMGNTAALSTAHPEEYFLNLDIGGGTTNLALGLAGRVQHTACLWIGARHLQFEPGTYRVTRLTAFGKSALKRAGVAAAVGEELNNKARGSLVAQYVSLLEKAVRGRSEKFLSQVPFAVKPMPKARLTFSGGVGELLYAGRFDEITPYGDLGVDLARGIAESRLLARDLATFRPVAGGRATVLGLALHGVEISGLTVYLAQPDMLPLPDLPIVAVLPAGADAGAFRAAIARALRSARPVAIRVDPGEGLEQIRASARALATALRAVRWPASRSLVVLVTRNVGKTFGNLVTDWGKLRYRLAVLDEVSDRPAQFVTIGEPRGGILPLSFYGSFEP